MTCSQPSTTANWLSEAFPSWGLFLHRLLLRRRLRRQKSHNLAMSSQLASALGFQGASHVCQEAERQAVSLLLDAQSVWPEESREEAHNNADFVKTTKSHIALDYSEGLNKALLTLDEKTIRDFYTKWSGDDLHPDNEIFWTAIHKTITGRKSLPFAFRKASKEWLQNRNLLSLDDGELNFPVDNSDAPF